MEYIIIGLLILKVVQVVAKKAKEMAEEMAEEVAEQQKAAEQVPQAIKELYEYEEPTSARKRIEAEGTLALRTHSPAKRVNTPLLSSDELQLETLEEEQEQGGVELWEGHNDLRTELQRGVIMKEILERKF